MNFKTTLVLIALLAVAGVYVIVSRSTEDTGKAPPTAGKLLAIESSEVSKLTITPADGPAVVFEKTGIDWRMTAPVSAAVDRFEVEGLLSQLTGLTSRGANDSEKIDHPSFALALTTNSGKTINLRFGPGSAVGEIVGVQIDGKSRTELVDSSILEKLDKKPEDYREKSLVKISAGEVRQLVITRAEGKLAFEKTGNDWRMTEPTQMPAEASEVSSLISTITGLRAAEFVSEDTSDAARYQLLSPRTSVFFSTQAPSTQPATTAPAGTTIAFGRYDDVLKKNVYASVSGSSSIVKIPVSSIDELKSKKPLDFRDRRVLDVDPADVSKVSIRVARSATTQPTTRPASQTDVVIERRQTDVLAAGPAIPATGPASQPSTQPATLPTPSRWVATSDSGKQDADDSKVDALLAEIHPLRVEKYIESVPSVLQPPTTYTLVVTAGPRNGAPVEHEVILRDRGADQPLLGSCNGLDFELPHALVSKLEATFSK